MSATGAITQQGPAAVANPNRTSVEPITLGGVAAKTIKLQDSVAKLGADLAGYVDSEARSTWFTADWFQTGAYSIHPDALRGALKNEDTKKSFLLEALLHLDGTSAAREGAKITDDGSQGVDGAKFSLDRITRNDVVKTLFRDTAQTDKDLAPLNGEWSPAEIAKMRPERAAYEAKLGKLAKSITEGATSIFYVSWYNGDDTTHNAIVAVNGKKGEIRLINEGQTG
jgi:hypothetical protein